MHRTAGEVGPSGLGITVRSFLREGAAGIAPELHGAAELGGGIHHAQEAERVAGLGAAGRFVAKHDETARSTQNDCGAQSPGQIHRV